MPITDIGSYVTTGEEFKSHWTDVNAARVAGGGTALVLADGYSLVILTTDVAAVAGGTDGFTSVSRSDKRLLPEITRSLRCLAPDHANRPTSCCCAAGTKGRPD